MFPMAAYNRESQSLFYAGMIKISMYWSGSAHQLSVMLGISVLALYLPQAIGKQSQLLLKATVEMISTYFCY